MSEARARPAPQAAQHPMGSRKQLFSSAHSSKDLPEFNVVLLGTLGVGKSALTVKYLTKRFIMEYDPSLEDVYSKTDLVDGQEINVKIMDTCDTSESKAERYLSWGQGYVVVYSVTSMASFEAARGYLEIVTSHQRVVEKEIPVALIGNKVDLERYRTVSKAAGEALATEFDTHFAETSAADDLASVERVFHDLFREISRINEGPLALQPLFITEDQHGSSRIVMRRTKSPRNPDLKDSKDRKDDKDARNIPRRTVSTFKIFNKGFKIFN